MAKNIRQLEAKLWSAAESLRGNLSAEEYMHIVLGVLSLKYISDKYNTAIKKIREDNLDPDIIDSIDFYNEYGAFKVPKESSWDYIINYANSEKIGEVMDKAFIKLENENKMLKNVFDKNYNRESIDQNKLGDVVKIFSEEDFSSEEDEDIVGRIYEYFLGHFFKDRGQKGGEFYTPTSIVELMINILKPLRGKIYDPACGTGGILVQSKRYINQNKGNFNLITVYGQEYNNITWKLAKLNILLHGFSLYDANDRSTLGEMSADTFTNDLHSMQKFDYVLANPPFNMKKWSQEDLIDDPRWKWGLPPKGNANYAWLSHIVDKMSSTGRGAVILANGSLSSSQKQEIEIRKKLIEDNKVDAIIQLPDKLFYTTGIPASIWFFNNKKVNNKVLMVSGSSLDGNMISKKLRELKDTEIKNIVKIFDMHEKGEDIDFPELAKTITINELKENDYSFVPGRYISSSIDEIDIEATKDEIRTLGKELSDLLSEFLNLTPKVEEAIEKAINFKKDDVQ
ncbi:class I SAM-dependent DNA methyltransferase [Spiroplasma endosymbiont of Aspidapion aeneum]|uniref:type I restriction-modification system subunit M n=1 Tax=Spiroplasma endosymbiont of Aspidapion aeneum TaxID=3066276 RepID=UPI00313B67F3